MGLTSPFRQPRQYLTPTAWELIKPYTYNIQTATQLSLLKESEDDFTRNISNGTVETGAVCNSIYLKQERYKSWLRIWSCLVWVKNRKFNKIIRLFLFNIFFWNFTNHVSAFIAPLLIIVGCYTQVLCKVTQTIKDLKKIDKNRIFKEVFLKPI